jgi:hypothetical protein
MAWTVIHCAPFETEMSVNMQRERKRTSLPLQQPERVKETDAHTKPMLNFLNYFNIYFLMQRNAVFNAKITQHNKLINPEP